MDHADFVAAIDRHGQHHFIASGDGRDWIEAPLQTTIEAMPAIPHVVSVGGDWFAASHGSPLRVWASANALDWSAIADVTAVGEDIESAIWMGTAAGHLFLEASDQLRIGPTWVSSDGVTWHETNLAIDVWPAAVAEFNGLLIIAASQFTGSHTETSIWLSEIP